MQTSVSLGGNVTNEGQSSVTERGIIYSTSDNTPEIGESGVIKDTNGSGTGNFWETISGLVAGTTYYFRAYATNAQGTGYGSIMSFNTLSPLTVVTLDATGANTSISFYGELSSNGGLTVTTRGFVYSTTDTDPLVGAPNVFYTGSSTSMSFSTFNKTVFGLTGNGTTYYYRAVVNSSEEGLAYGDVLSFVLVSDATVATVTANNIMISSAELGGNIINDGGGTILERGVVYSSTDTNPLIGDPEVIKDINETGMNPFSKVITGLAPASTYYFRAYAINEAGTRYGSLESFSTLTLSVDNNEIKGFEYYPNPVTNIINIKADTILKNMAIYAPSGQLIQKENIDAKEAKINVSKLNPGIYFIKVESVDNITTKTIIKK